MEHTPWVALAKHTRIGQMFAHNTAAGLDI